MKKVFLITVTAIFVAMIVFLCLFLAGNRQSDELSEPINPYPNYQNIVFLKDWTNLYIDTLTDEYSSMIFDMRKYELPTNSNHFGNIDNLILYFSNWSIDTKSTRFFKYDIVTEVISEIEYESNFTSQAHMDFYALGDYLYYSAFDDWYDLDERVEYLCRIPINGGKEEIIGEYANREEKICLVIKNKVITADHHCIYAYDLRNNKKTTLWDAKATGYYGTSSFLHYYDGKLYFLSVPQDKDSVELDDEEFIQKWGTTSNTLLLSLDIKTKKAVKLSDTPIYSFYLTKDKIYYIPKEYGVIEKNGSVFPRYSSKTIYTFSHSGEDISEVCTVEDISMNKNNIYYADDEKIYVGQSSAIFRIDPKTGEAKIQKRKQ